MSERRRLPVPEARTTIRAGAVGGSWSREAVSAVLLELEGAGRKGGRLRD
ncbi:MULTISPECIES: hypothetical protein [unclassified Rhodococcus (in: high G+C Gram-positive bacteria)]